LWQTKGRNPTQEQAKWIKLLPREVTQELRLVIITLSFARGLLQQHDSGLGRQQWALFPQGRDQIRPLRELAQRLQQFLELRQ
jgi:hypothetical protein